MYQDNKQYSSKFYLDEFWITISTLVAILFLRFFSNKIA